MRNNHHDRSVATLALLWCVNEASSVNWNLVSASLLSFGVDVNPPPARWKCGNPACFSPDFQARWKEGETRLGSFPRFPRGVISTALFISLCPRSAATPGFYLPFGSFFRSGPKSEISSPKSCARIAQERRSLGPSTEDIPLWLRPTSRCALCAWIPRASRCGARCAPAGPECCRPKSGPRSARATARPAVGW
jgi:hypothetical protein